MECVYVCGDGHYLHLQTQFGEDQCTQFRVIVVTDPQTNTQTRQGRLQYTVLLSLACSVNIMAVTNSNKCIQHSDQPS